MSSARLLVVLGHPDTRSFGGALADAYAERGRPLPSARPAR